MNIQIIADCADQNALPDAASGSGPKARRRIRSSKSSKPPAKTKQDQLVALLSKPNGVRVTVISQRLGWQAHTVRAAISGLRKRGNEIVTSKSPKTGEMVYAINTGATASGSAATEASS
ncbi:MAG: DUF3489 domain-containing protein [Alphaproteobacteria bacterium]|nr:DUF3489 domain-containing protein [Alphaproteobacteria bacterium]